MFLDLCYIVLSYNDDVLVGDDFDFIHPSRFITSLLVALFKVVALAIMSKSNLKSFWWIGTVVSLICVSAVLCRSLLACMNYRRNK